MKIHYQALMRLHLLYIVLLVLLPGTVYSQGAGSCAEKLKNAQTLFVNGKVEQVAPMLQECMKSGFNREESLTAYKLLIQSYLFEEKMEMADSTMLAFLKKNPEYQVSPTDHSSFVYLFNNFKVKPVVKISFHFGTSKPFLTFVGPRTTSSEPAKSTYSSGAINLFTSIEAKFEITKKLELNFEPGFSQLSFTKVEEFLGFGKTNYKESQSRIEIPLSATYNLKSFGKFTAYGRLGAGPAITLGSTATPSFNPTDINGTPHTGTDVSRKDSRIFMDFFAQAGAGVKFKTRGGFLFGEVRSNIGLLNQIIRGDVLAEDLKYYYYYVDDNFHLNSVNINVGYTQIFYKPTKVK